TDGHHLKHWSDDGRTTLDNLVSLCRFHQGRHHDGALQNPRRRPWRIHLHGSERDTTRTCRHAASSHAGGAGGTEPVGTRLIVCR
ncbi:MAG TPA: HNH endonuclease signature motif containing protein, partial [Mycobacterium sp.]|nr:HNH endonuclease signature motif containing protein [Mycobacterium sp.]